MIKYINKDDQILPILMEELYFFDPVNILLTCQDSQRLINSMPNNLRDVFLFSFTTKERSCFPRFDIDLFNMGLANHPVMTAIPDLSIKNFSKLSTVTDKRANEFLAKSKSYNNVRLFYSGGIDSTLILCSIIKNWSKNDIEKLTVVGNKFSIQENEYMYNNFIKDKIKTESFNDYITGAITFSSDCLYTSGDGGDNIGSAIIDEFDILYPNKHMSCWKQNKDIILNYFCTVSTINFGVPFLVYDRRAHAEKCFEWISKTIEHSQLDIVSIYDFFWWINFNFGFTIDTTYPLWSYFKLPQDTHVSQTWKDNIFPWFTNIDYQYWSLSTIGSTEKILEHNNKYAFKKYIFEVDGNENYFLNKGKESSMPKNFPKFRKYNCNRLLFIDRNDRAYYR
jgi:hypothetical protein